MAEDAVLTIPEVAVELRCSRAQVYNLINGKVRGASSLPTIVMGRRKLVRRSTLERWKCANERDELGNAILAESPEVTPLGAHERKAYAEDGIKSRESKT